MKQLVRVTGATIDVLDALIDGGDAVWGLRVIKTTGRPPGSVYPILERLERSGWVVSEWEDDSERSGPRRRFYRLTADGAVAAGRAVSAFRARPQTGTASAARPVAPALAARVAPPVGRMRAPGVIA